MRIPYFARQGIRIIILLHIAIDFSQIINLLSHTDLTTFRSLAVREKQISRKTHRYTRVCHPAEKSSKLHSSEELKFLSSQPMLIRVGGKADKRGRSDAQSVRFAFPLRPAT